MFIESLPFVDVMFCYSCIFSLNVTNPHEQLEHLCGRGGGNQQELVWPDPHHCFHSKSCWVCSLHNHPSCQILVWTPNVSLCELNPTSQEMYEGWLSSAQLSPARPCQLSLMPLPPNDFPTDTHRSLAYPADLSLTIFVS